MNAKNSTCSASSQYSSPCCPTNPGKIVEGLKDGKPIKFYIQEIPKDRYDDALEHMCTYFLVDEAMFSSRNVKDDPAATEEMRMFWQRMLEHNVSVCAFVDNPNGGKPIIAGANVLYLLTKDTEADFKKIVDNLKHESILQILKAVVELGSTVDLQEMYGTEEYLGALGLSMATEFRGNSIGYHLLEARNDIGKKHGISLTTTAFTSPVAAKQAERAGFVTLTEKLASDYVDDQGELIFPNCKSKSFKFMTKRLL